MVYCVSKLSWYNAYFNKQMWSKKMNLNEIHDIDIEIRFLSLTSVDFNF